MISHSIHLMPGQSSLRRTTSSSIRHKRASTIPHKHASSLHHQHASTNTTRTTTQSPARIHATSSLCRTSLKNKTPHPDAGSCIATAALLGEECLDVLCETFNKLFADDDVDVAEGIVKVERTPTPPLFLLDNMHFGLPKTSMRSREISRTSPIAVLFPARKKKPTPVPKLPSAICTWAAGACTDPARATWAELHVLCPGSGGDRQRQGGAAGRPVFRLGPLPLGAPPHLPLLPGGPDGPSHRSPPPPA